MKIKKLLQNRMLTCKQAIIFSIVMMFIFAIVSYFIICPQLSVIIRTSIELIIFFIVILYAYCKKNKITQ